MCVCVRERKRHHESERIHVCNSFMYVYLRLVNACVGIDTATCINTCDLYVCICIHIQTQSHIHICNSFVYLYIRLLDASVGVDTATCITLVIYMCAYVYMYRREVGGWGRDPKKCTGRDWGMGSSTI